MAIYSGFCWFSIVMFVYQRVSCLMVTGNRGTSWPSTAELWRDLPSSVFGGLSKAFFTNNTCDFMWFKHQWWDFTGISWDFTQWMLGKISENHVEYGKIRDMIYWLVVEPYPSEKYDESSVGMMTFPIYGKIVPNHQPDRILLGFSWDFTGIYDDSYPPVILFCRADSYLELEH